MTDLPVENELIDGWYFDTDGQLIRVKDGAARWYESHNRVTPLAPRYRLGRVAEYRRLPREPMGLGAVVERPPTSERWVRAYAMRGRPWLLVHGSSMWTWDEITGHHPVTVLSEGVQL